MIQAQQHRATRPRATVHAELDAATHARDDAARRLDFDAYTACVAHVRELLDEAHAARAAAAHADRT